MANMLLEDEVGRRSRVVPCVTVDDPFSFLVRVYPNRQVVTPAADPRCSDPWKENGFLG